jgi:hypothetical protein
LTSENDVFGKDNRDHHDRRPDRLGTPRPEHGRRMSLHVHHQRLRHGHDEEHADEHAVSDL